MRPTQASTPRHNALDKDVGRAGERTAAKCAAWRCMGCNSACPEAYRTPCHSAYLLSTLSTHLHFCSLGLAATARRRPFRGYELPVIKPGGHAERSVCLQACCAAQFALYQSVSRQRTFANSAAGEPPPDSPSRLVSDVLYWY